MVRIEPQQKLKLLPQSRKDKKENRRDAMLRIGQMTSGRAMEKMSLEYDKEKIERKIPRSRNEEDYHHQIIT